MDRKAGILTWNIVFEQRTHDHVKEWFHYVIPTRWAHVWAYAWDPYTGIYLTINPIGNHMKIDAQPVAAHPNEVMREIALRPTTTAIVSFTKEDEPPLKIKSHKIYTCVSVIKDIVSIDDFWCITPLHLFKKLKTVGGRVLYVDNPRDLEL